MPTSPLAELAASVRRLERLRRECPERVRPSAAVMFANVDRAKVDVVSMTTGGQPDQAMAVVADFEREARKLLAPKLLAEASR